jgi:hypothetical protein
MRKLTVLSVVGALLAISGPAWACAALIGARGSVQLGRTTTLAAYVDGKEHYITAFEFAGGGGEFGSIVPLPGIPESIEKAGEWTLQRLIRETQPQAEAAFSTASSDGRSAEVIQEVRIDALDITILRGGGGEVGRWAKDHGFLLPPDAPVILDFYASRSPIFMAAVFNAEAAEERGQRSGDGTAIHLTIPTLNPWVPLRILTLGKAADEVVTADVYLLTERKPVLLPVRGRGIELRLREPASEALLADLRSDQGMQWLPPTGMWLTYMAVNAAPSDLRFDLSADATGRGVSYRMAGLPEPKRVAPAPSPTEPSPSPSPSPEPSPSTTQSLALVDRGSNSTALWWAVSLLVAVGIATGVLRFRRLPER